MATASRQLIEHAEDTKIRPEGCKEYKANLFYYRSIYFE